MFFSLIIVFIGTFVTVIDAGEVGVVNTFGYVGDSPLRSGLNFKNPFANVITMSIRTNEYTMAAATNEGQIRGDDSIEARASDGAIVWIDATVYYHLNPEKAVQVYKEIGVDYREKIVRPEARAVIREIIAKYPVNELYSTKRDEVAVQLRDALKEKVDNRGVIVEDVLLRNVILSKILADSIEEKLTAQQEAQKLDFLIEREKKEAERKLIEAEGQKAAQRVIGESLTDKYLYYLYINILREHEGTIYIPTEGGLPLFKNVNE